MDELSVMGIAEILPKYRALKRRMRQTARGLSCACAGRADHHRQPRFLAASLARLVKAASDIRTIHYVAPSVWAWRSGRAAKMAQSCRSRAGAVAVRAALHGSRRHAAAISSGTRWWPSRCRARPRCRRSAPRMDWATAPVVLVLPGSRRAEVGRLTPVFGRSVAIGLCTRTRRPAFVVPAAAPVSPRRCWRPRRDWPGDPWCWIRASMPDAMPSPQARRLPRRRRGAGGLRHGLAGTGGIGDADGDRL